MGEYTANLMNLLTLLLTCSLKPLDIEFMKQLHNLVNIIPVIAKADTLTATELKSLKLKVGLDKVCKITN